MERLSTRDRKRHQVNRRLRVQRTQNARNWTEEVVDLWPLRIVRSLWARRSQKPHRAFGTILFEVSSVLPVVSGRMPSDRFHKMRLMQYRDSVRRRPAHSEVARLFDVPDPLPMVGQSFSESWPLAIAPGIRQAKGLVSQPWSGSARICASMRRSPWKSDPPTRPRHGLRRSTTSPARCGRNRYATQARPKL